MELTQRKLDSLSTSQKRGLYKKAKDAYYNSQPIMSDRSFDLLEDDLREIVPNWSGFTTGSKVKNVKKKVPLPIPMFSLSKIKPAGANKWLSAQSGPAVVSLKADGASLELVYKDGRPVQAITRGDGRIGGDVSYLIPHMRIPQKVGTASFIVRCEVLFTSKAFAKYREVFDAARNAASGLLNRQDIHKAVKDLSVVVLQVLKPNPILSKGLAWAKAKGFAVIPHKTVKDIRGVTSDLLTKILISQKAKAKFQIDGLVVALDRVNPLPKNGDPDWAVAFKIAQEGTETTVRKVSWDVSHTGSLTPTIEYDPVDWEGSKLKFATAFNAKFVVQNKIGPGAKVVIERSGDIIPFIAKVTRGTKAQVPDKNQFGTYHVSGVHFVLDNPKASDDFRVKRMTKFFGEIKADFMREKTVRRLFDQGFTNLRKILNAKPQAFVGDGISERGAQRLYEAIHSVLDKKLPLTLLMAASTTFPRGMGERRFQSLGERFDLLKLASLDKGRQKDLITQVPGWQGKTADAFIEGLPKFIKWLDVVKVPYTNDTGKAAPKKTKKSGSLSGVGVTWTSYRDKEQESIVENNGGEIVPFGSRTSVLLYSPTGKASSKVDKAQAKGIPTMTWDKFAKKYGL